MGIHEGDIVVFKWFGVIVGGFFLEVQPRTIKYLLPTV
jgi:hypothetical protein